MRIPLAVRQWFAVRLIHAAERLLDPSRESVAIVRCGPRGVPQYVTVVAECTSCGDPFTCTPQYSRTLTRKCDRCWGKAVRGKVE